ncbi:MAG: hypothetical protein RLZZ337_1409 [Bacteroidota bacterium]|jgi:rod shape-determining protein MreD
MNRVLYWIVLIALQVFVFNHLEFSSYIMPQLFILLLITLPVHLSKHVQVLIAFGLGLIADFFVATPGIHASACLSLMVLRMGLLSRLDLKEQEANKLAFNARTVGIPSFMYTTIILVFFYHLYIFIIENLGAFNVLHVFLTTLLSSSFTLLLIGFVQYVSFNRLSE